MFALPWLVISLILYNILVYFFAGEGVTAVQYVSQEVFSLPMMSGETWSVSIGDLLLTLTFLLLFVEIIKATRTSASSMVDHGLSTLVFIVALVEFILWPGAATSVFFFIMLATLIDVVAGFSVTMQAARRDVEVGGGGGLLGH